MRHYTPSIKIKFTIFTRPKLKEMKKEPETFRDKGEKAINESGSAQVTLFEQFIADCTVENVRTAYERFLNGVDISSSSSTQGEESHKIKPDDELKYKVQTLINDMYKDLEDKTKSALAIVAFDYTSKHENVVHTFFTDIYSGKKYDDAVREAFHIIGRDETLKKDAAFFTEFKKITDELRPKKVQKYKDGIKPKDGLLFDFEHRPSYQVDGEVNKGKVEERMNAFLLDLYKSHLPKNEIITKEEVEVDLACIRKTGKTPISLRVAFEDTMEISVRANNAAKLAHDNVLALSKNKEKYAYNPTQHQNLIEEGLKNALTSFQKAPKKSKTERVDLVRDLIINLAKATTIVEKESLFQQAIATAELLTPAERLRNEGFNTPAPDAVKTMTLADAINRNKASLMAECNRDNCATLLQNAYESVMRWKMDNDRNLNHERDVILVETDFLLKGTKSASIKESVYEIAEKRHLYILSEVYNQAIEEIKNPNQQHKKKQAQDNNGDEYYADFFAFEQDAEAEQKKKSGYGFNSMN